MAVKNLGLTEVQVDAQGRMVLPASVRRSLGIRAAETLILHVDSGRLVLEKRETVLARLRERFRHIPPEVSLADELIEQRRAEAQLDRL